MRSKNNKIQIWGYTIIAFFSFLIYLPSLSLGPRADQCLYLLGIKDKVSFWDLTFGCMDMNRTTPFIGGDEILFRPVVLFLLGLEQYFFGYYYILWQLTGILLHLGVIWCLVDLLMAIFAGWEAILATAFFAFLFVSIEMVVWDHINSYLIALSVALIALKWLYQVLNGKEIKKSGFASLYFFLLIGVFTHEIINVLAVIMAFMLWIRRKEMRNYALYILTVPIFYMIASVTNFIYNHCSLHSNHALHISGFLYNFFYSMSIWIFVGLFSFVMPWEYGMRIMMAPVNMHLTNHLNIFLMPTFAGTILLSLCIYLLCKNRVSKGDARIWLAVATGLLIIIFAALVSIGRSENFMIKDIIRANTHYFYVFWLFFVIVLYSLIDWSSISKMLKCFFSVILAVFIIFNAVKIYDGNIKETTSYAEFIKGVKKNNVVHGS